MLFPERLNKAFLNGPPVAALLFLKTQSVPVKVPAGATVTRDVRHVRQCTNVLDLNFFIKSTHVTQICEGRGDIAAH